MKIFTTVQAPVNVTEEVISALFSCAIEGGSDYWCSKIRSLTPELKQSYDIYMINGFFAYLGESFEDCEVTGKDKTKYVVTVDDIKDAVKLMAEKYPKHFNDSISDGMTAMDAETGDIFLQLCCFKSVVFG